jgi:uncharacterized protein YjbI with pentapeptide repeats
MLAQLAGIKPCTSSCPLLDGLTADDVGRLWHEWSPLHAVWLALVDGACTGVCAVGWLESCGLPPVLKGADLRGADLSGAYLSEANLSEAYLSGADLSGADLSGANLSGAIFYRVYLRAGYLSRARYNNQTLWPDGFTPPADAINVDETGDSG